jgi:hypothetical protein
MRVESAEARAARRAVMISGEIKMRQPFLVLLAAPLALLVAQPAAAQEATLSFEGSLQPCANSHPVPLEAGRRYVIRAASTVFDTVVQVYRAGNVTVLAEDDDGGDGTSSRLDFVAPESGDYLVCVASYGGRGAGAYTVDVTPAAALPPPATRPTGRERTRWQVYEGTLGEGDAEEGGKRFDDYEITLRDGERALISLDSSAFDPVVSVYPAASRGGQPAASDDDGGGGLNAFLVLAPDEPGTFIVRATTFSENAGGAYRLRIATERAPARPD